MQVRVAVVGAGSMGMNHLRVLKDFDEERVQLVVVIPRGHGGEQRAIPLQRCGQRGHGTADAGRGRQPVQQPVHD